MLSIATSPTSPPHLRGVLSRTVANSRPTHLRGILSGTVANLRPTHVRGPVSGTDANSRPDEQQVACQRIVDMLGLVSDALKPQRRVVHAGEAIYRAGERFGNLYILNSGFVKILNLSPDGREQLVGLKFRGDWLGFDGIANDAYSGSAIAMDTGEVWAFRYEALLAARAEKPALLTALHTAMSREIACDRDSWMAVCTLPAAARVADFLRYWTDAIGKRGMRTDQITLRMTRAEIGNYLGMTLETVSRALSKLARDKVIGFPDKDRREVCIPDTNALAAFVQRCLAQSPALQGSVTMA